MCEIDTGTQLFLMFEVGLLLGMLISFMITMLNS